MKQLNDIVLVTSTFKRPQRINYIKRCISIFKKVNNIKWVVIEDGDTKDSFVESLLHESGIKYIYQNIGPTRNWGNSQRDYGLRYIRDNNLEGIVYIADDDNYYNLSLFTEIAKTETISIFPVGHLGPHFIERPVVRNGKIIDWDAGWKERKFPVDAAGFAFHTKLLEKLNGQIWTYDVRGGETEFLESIINSSDEFEILCDNCKQCYVWHNQPLGQSPVYTHTKNKIIKFCSIVLIKFKSFIKKYR
ncbi:MAG: hypothetical protein MRK02_15200 [Candidatus Scalindua sp.]|nr:hypothetical protein [Candidatus Scalindua sp.]